jgi:hypothetical protein
MAAIKHAILMNAVVVNDHVIPGLGLHETPEWLPEAMYRRLEEFHAKRGEAAGLDLPDLSICRDLRRGPDGHSQYMAFRIEWRGAAIEGLAEPHLMPLSRMTFASLAEAAGASLSIPQP